MTDHKSQKYEEALTRLAQNSAMALFLGLLIGLGLLIVMLCITVLIGKMSSNPNSQQETDVEKGGEVEDADNKEKV